MAYGQNAPSCDPLKNKRPVILYPVDVWQFDSVYFSFAMAVISGPGDYG